MVIIFFRYLLFNLCNVKERNCELLQGQRPPERNGGIVSRSSLTTLNVHKFRVVFS
nr:MAG TPA: hypothetical protein [Caudoviricetes sp.]